MVTELNFLSILLGILWFFAFWIFGGVFFSVVALLRLGRIKKVRFSCLFTIWTAICATVASYYGVKIAGQAISVCLKEATTRTEIIASVFTCGFWGIFGTGAGAFATLLAGGLVIMFLSRAQSKEWIVLDNEEPTVEGK